MEPALWPLGLHFVAALLLVGAMLGISAVLGERHRERATGEQYEAGIRPSGPPRPRVPSRFYMVAMIFVIFDLEAVFFFAWAVAARDAGWSGYAGILVFTVILLVGLLYEWRQGVLDWAPPLRRPSGAPEPAGEPSPDLRGFREMGHPSPVSPTASAAPVAEALDASDDPGAGACPQQSLTSPEQRLMTHDSQLETPPVVRP